MLLRIRRLREAEDGGVSIDWVAMSAGVVGMGILVISLIQDAATDPAEGIGAELAASGPEPVVFD